MKKPSPQPKNSATTPTSSTHGACSTRTPPTPQTTRLAGGENINNAADMIKRKLLRQNASPDKAVRFGNLYSRLLTQPVLSQKWAILYLLYRLSGSDEYDGGDGDEEMMMVDSRSPQVETGNLQSMLFKGQRARRGTIQRMAEYSDEDGPAVSSSASQIPARVERKVSARRQQQELENEKAREAEYDSDRARDVRPPAPVSRSRANTGAREPLAPAMEPVQQEQPTVEKVQSVAPPSEHGLLRDLPFNLQGLSSSSLEFLSPSTLKLPTTLPVPMVSLLNTLAEPCLLYRGLANFVESSGDGLLSQSLRAALSIELRSYLGLVATLEGEIRRALVAISESDDAQSAFKSGVTLKRCVVWTRDATMALRLMSLIVEEAQSNNRKGGQLISLIHGFSTSHGDPFVCAFAEKILAQVTRPFYDMLRLWIYDGELSDPYKEFFVFEPEFRPSTDPRRIATSVWEDKYKLDDDMVPSIITQEFAKKIFLIGKSLNFIRYGCGDSGWVEAYSKEASKELRYGDTASLETSIDEAYKTTMARLIYLMDDKFKLFDHLRALKKYLLLGQGDFIALLMESLASNLDRPANSQYRHTLTAQLEHAIRASNAQYDPPDVLRRLDARMLELSHGEIGWDCFTLEYKIDAPVDVVITPWGSTQYLKVFNFLWRVKRVEFALGSTWRRCMTGARGVLGSVDDKVGYDWKRARCAIAEMIHFVNQLQYYILFEVIESSWDQLQASVSKPGCTLDDLIEAHTIYLDSITHKGLLGSTSSSKTASTNREDSFLTQLHTILKIMLSYKDAVDGLYSFSVAEFTRRQEVSAKIETRTAQGRWGLTERDLLSSRRTASSSISTPNLASRPGGNDGMDTPSSLAHHDLSADDHMLSSLRVRLRDLSAEFRSRLNILLGDLAYQPDLDMRFLGVVMNFNDVYEPVRRRRTVGASSREKERARRKAAAAAAGASADASDSHGNAQPETKREKRDVGAVDVGNASSG
ncbi:tubulin gamma complex associated family protein [Aspergillus candidus]|uniref:Spc98 family-domain-containing protein n=1 Tax=Aspergillus candidus TaxID=41067 RepID=A0A2I2FJB7_ASPCN|nr:Spc98 family-domain-containing protein [Aspergillus candidus]PLB40716.1 Spc98 family-domain-containing protein [Aspergillus candidus]